MFENTSEKLKALYERLLTRLDYGDFYEVAYHTDKLFEMIHANPKEIREINDRVYKQKIQEIHDDIVKLREELNEILERDTRP